MCSCLKLRRIHVVPLGHCTWSHTPVMALHKASSPIETVGGDQGVNAKTPQPMCVDPAALPTSSVPQALQTIFPEYHTFFFTHISTLHFGGVHRPWLYILLLPHLQRQLHRINWKMAFRWYVPCAGKERVELGLIEIQVPIEAQDRALVDAEYYHGRMYIPSFCSLSSVVPLATRPDCSVGGLISIHLPHICRSIGETLGN